MLEDLETLGLNGQELSVKCGQESAVVEVQKELQRLRDAMGNRRTTLDNSRLGDSDSNGKIERAVGESAAMVRTFRAALEENIGEPVDLNHPIVPWLVRYAGEVITRYRVRKNGRTAF